MSNGLRLEEQAISHFSSGLATHVKAEDTRRLTQQQHMDGKALERRGVRNFLQICRCAAIYPRDAVG